MAMQSPGYKGDYRTMIKIEDGIPMPKPRRRGRGFGPMHNALAALEVGQSFRIEHLDIGNLKVQCVRTGRRLDRTFSVGTDYEGARRVWRRS